MNKIIFLITLSVSLTVAALSRADVLPRIVTVQTTNIDYDATSMTILVSGYLPTQCVVTPRPKLSASSNPDVLILSVVGEDHSQFCTMMLGGGFELAFDIRSLKFDLIELSLDPEATYKIIKEDGTFIADVAFGDTVTGINTTAF